MTLLFIVASLLVLEGGATGLWFSWIVPHLDAYLGVALVLVVVRGLTGALQFMSGIFLFGRRPAARPLAAASLVASAILTALEVWAGLAPSSLPTSWEWPFAFAYAAYAGIGVWVLVKRP